MPRAVTPWTWRRMLRDHGPDDPRLLLSLYVLGTWMDRDGFAWPSQQTWARGARASVRTIQRHLTKALHLQWLGVGNAGRGGQGWRHNVYRCAVPDWVELDEHDETLADRVASEFGVVEGRDTAMSPRSIVAVERDDTKPNGVATSKSQRDDTGRQNVPTTGCRTNSHPETPALRTHAQEEARTSVRALSLRDFLEKIEDPNRRAREAKKADVILDLLGKGYAWSDIVTFTKSYGTTREDVSRCEAHARELRDQF